MKEKFKKSAIDNFVNQGFSCSESVVKAAVDLGIVPAELINVATSFSGGMSSRCACGALTGAQIIIGYLHGKQKDNTARELAAKMYAEFCAVHKVACCKVLSAGFKDFHSKERKLHCANMIESSCEILFNILEELKVETK